MNTEKIRLWIFGMLGGLVLFLLTVTTRHRVRWCGTPVTKKELQGHLRETLGERGAMMAQWHETLLTALSNGIWISSLKSVAPIDALISQHGDGRIIARAVSTMGIHSVDGSSTRGGLRAFLKLKGSLKKGNWIVITPDGPRGPRQKLKEGVAKLAAQESRTKILPVRVWCSRAYECKSWDRMKIPYPFSTVVLDAGPAFYWHEAPEGNKREYLEGLLALEPEDSEKEYRALSNL